MDADTDEDVINTFTKGVDPEGRPVNDGNHKFSLSATEQTGMMAYLRSLTPSGYPEVDPAQKGN